jgi:hypothetical protein
VVSPYRGVASGAVAGVVSPQAKNSGIESEKGRGNPKFRVEKQIDTQKPMVASRVVRVGELRSSRIRDIRELDRLKPMREPRRTALGRGRNIFSERDVEVTRRPPSQRIRPRPVAPEREQPAKTLTKDAGCVLPRRRPRPALSVRDYLSKPSAEGGIGSFGERPPIFERSTISELARFCSDRARMRKEAERSKRSRAEEHVLEVTVSSPSEELQVTVPGAGVSSRLSRKNSRWDTPLDAVGKPPERVATVAEKMEVEVTDPGQARDEAEGESVNLGDGRKSGPVAPLVLPLRVGDLRVSLGLSRPKEPAAAPLSVSGMVLSDENSAAYGSRPEGFPQPGISTVKVKVMVDAGGGFSVCRRAIYSPRIFQSPLLCLCQFLLMCYPVRVL